MHRRLLWPVFFAGLATGVHAGETAAEKLRSEVDRLQMASRGSPGAILVTRSVEGRGQPLVRLTYAFSGWLFADGLYRSATACEVPASSFSLVTRGSDAGSGSLEVDLADPRVRCSSLTWASRVRFRIEPRPGGDGSDLHVTSVVETGGSRYHVEGREQSWQVAIWVWIDGYDIGPFSPSGYLARSDVTSYRSTSVGKAQ